MADKTYLPATQPTLDGTFWVDKDGKPYMVYCGEWLQNWNGTIEKIELKPDLSGSIGEGKVLFRAFDSPWSREVENGVVKPNKVTDGPYLFKTGWYSTMSAPPCSSLSSKPAVWQTTR